MGVLASELKKIFSEDIAANNSISEGLLVKLGSTLNSVIDNHLWQLGDIRPSALTEAQFAALNGYSLELPMAQRRWVRIEGQSVDGSAFTALTGIKTLPNALANGAHLEQILSGGTMLEYFSNQNKSHYHQVYCTGAFGNAIAIEAQPISGYANTITSSPEGGAKARPNSITVNFFIKINN